MGITGRLLFSGKDFWEVFPPDCVSGFVLVCLSPWVNTPTMEPMTFNYGATGGGGVFSVYTQV